MSVSGSSQSVRFSVPSWPELLRPQQYARPPKSPSGVMVSPQVCWSPAARAKNRCGVATGVARALLTVSPVPSCPKSLDPQQWAVPSIVSAQLCDPPDVIDFTTTGGRTTRVSSWTRSMSPYCGSRYVATMPTWLEPVGAAGVALNISRTS